MEIFLIFVKGRKSARKVSSMHECFENSNMQWKKIGKIEKSKMVESKYEIRSDLPSARACHFESDKWDLPLAVITTVWLVMEN